MDLNKRQAREIWPAVRKNAIRWIELLVFPAVVLVVWQAAVSMQVLHQNVLPLPLDVLAVTFDLATGMTGVAARYSGTLLDHATASTARVLAGFFLGSGLGIIFGLLIGLSRLVERMFDPTIQVLRNIPVTAWVPLALVFFGIGNPPSVFLIALGAFFPSVVNTTHGVRQTDVTLVRASRMMGATYGELLRKVIFPAALPSIMTGIRLSLGIAWVLVVVAEMLAVRSGLGYLLNDAYLFYRNDVVIATMAIIGLLGFLSDKIVIAVRMRVLSWNSLEVFGGNN